MPMTMVRFVAHFVWILVLAGLVAACGPAEKGESNFLLPDEGDSLRVQSFGVEFFFSDSARVSARMLAGRIVEREVGEEGKTPPSATYQIDRGLTIYFLNNMGLAHSTLRADSAQVNRENGMAELHGNVVLSNDRGERMLTSRLNWDRKKDSLSTTAPVRVEMRDRIINGRNGFRSNTSFTAYTFYGITGEMEADDVLP